MSWRTVTIGDLVENYSVRAKSLSDYSSFEFYGVSNEDGITKSKYAAEEKAEEYKIIEKGCFAFNPYRINVGSIAFVDKDIKGFISPAYTIFKAKPNSIIPELLLKFLKSNEGLRQIKLHARGTVRQALRFEDLCKIKMTIPDYDEQKNLFKKVSAVENETIAINIEIDHQLNIVTQLRQEFFREAMQGKLVPQDPNDEPASELLKRIKEEKAKLIAEGKLKKEKPLPEIKPEEIPYEIPLNWVWCRLGEITSLITDGKHGDCDNESNSGYYFLSAKDVQKGKLIYLNARQITYKDFEEVHRRTNLEVGDLCMVNTGATVGKSAIAQADIKTTRTTFQKSVAVIKLIKPFVLSKYLESVLIFETPRLMKTSWGTAINNLLLGDLKLLCIPLPPLSEQQRIVSKLNQLMQFCDQLEENINTTKEQTNLLLQTVLREALEPKEAAN